MAYIEVDIDLDEFDVSDIVDFLERILSRNSKESDKKIILQFIKDNGGINSIVPKTLDDKMKVEHLTEIFSKYTLSQIETALPNF